MTDLDTEMVAAATASRNVADATVIIIAYTMERWSLTCAAVDSVLNQTLPPREIILCVEGSSEFAERFREQWPQEPGSVPAIRVQRQEPTPPAGGRERASYACKGSRAGAERNRGVMLAEGEVVVFLDDDAAAEPDWLRRLLAPFADPAVVGVGGAPLPVYAKPRPRWFPSEFDWVFGCAYKGLPTETAPAARLIGANMAVRRDSFLAVGGFQSMAEDMDMSHRLWKLSPDSRLVYEPRAIVRHYVPEDRLTWHYFWRRCFSAGRAKVSVLKGLGPAANMSAERSFLARSLTLGVASGLREFLSGDAGGLERALSIIAGTAVSAVAYAVGVVEWSVPFLRERQSNSEF